MALNITDFNQERRHVFVVVTTQGAIVRIWEPYEGWFSAVRNPEYREDAYGNNGEPSLIKGAPCSCAEHVGIIAEI